VLCVFILKVIVDFVIDDYDDNTMTQRRLRCNDCDDDKW